MDWRAHSPFLDVGAGDFVALPEFVDELRRIGFQNAILPGCVGIEKIVRPGENVVDTGPARANEHGRGHAASGGFPSEKKGFFHVFHIARPCANSRSLLAGIVEQKAELLRVQTGCATGGCARAKHGNSAVRAAMRGRLISGTAHAHGYARPDIIAESHGAQEVGAADAELLTGGECGRYDGGAGVRAGRTVGVVGLVGMREDAIGECGFNGAAHHL